MASLSGVPRGISSAVAAHDILNTSDHLLDVSTESLTHHPSLISAYESELQFDESTFQHESEPYRSQVRSHAICDRSQWCGRSQCNR